MRRLHWPILITALFSVLAWNWAGEIGFGQPTSLSSASSTSADQRSIKPDSLSAPFDEKAAKDFQKRWADYLQIQPQVSNSLGMKFALIPPGTFLMGTPDTESGREKNEAQHRVTLTKPFMLGIHDVTMGQFRQFVTIENYQTDAEKLGGAICWRDLEGRESKKDAAANWKNPGFIQTDDHPVVCVSLNDAQQYCAWLSKKEGKVYRISTEAEWEYACRAGTQSAYPWGDRPDEGKGWANCVDLTAKEAFPQWTSFQWQDGFVYTSPVGSFKPNAFGLYDMIGNVWQWCTDWGADYPDGAATDPVGPKQNMSTRVRVLRGGAWNSGPVFSRSGVRVGDDTNGSGFNTGFRIVLDVAVPEQK